MKPGRELTFTRWLFNEQPAQPPNPTDPDWAAEALNLIQQGMVVIDARGLILEVNQSACQILGYQAAELKGQSCMYVAPPEIQLQGDRFIAGLLRQSNKIKSHWVMRQKNGTYLTVTAEFKARHSEKNGACVLIVFAVDDKTDPIRIAQRAQAERDASHMALSYGMLQQVINSIPARIAYFDSKTLHCVFGNEAFAQGHAQHVKALHNKTLQDLLLPASWSSLKPHFELAALGQAIKFDHTESDLVGSVRHFQCDLLPHFARTGEQIGIFSLSVDITAHHLAELALMESESRLNAALATEKELGELKTAFVSMASHELRTPLAVIQGAVDLLLHYGNRLPEADRDASLNDIQGAVQRMALIMENILILGRMGRPDVDTQVPVNIPQFLESMASETKRLFARPQRILVESPMEAIDTASSDGDNTLLLDETSLHHVVGNLLSNACKYSGPEAQVCLAWQKIQGAGHAELCITVADQGIGIPVEHMPYLFQTFQRASNVGKIPGTGLGLSIAKRAIDNMGGRIEVDSRPGEGTSFRVYVPWQASDQRD